MELVYKSAGDPNKYDPYIIVLQKLDNTITNECRTNVVNADYAMFRANKLRVVKIYDRITGNEKQSIQCRNSKGKLVTYKCGEIVTDPKFDINPEIVYKEEIQYWKTVTAVQFHYLPIDYEGEYRSWYDNGQLHEQSTYVNGDRHGPAYYWHQNGSKQCECNYVEDVKDGKCTEWYENGYMESECTYVDGLIQGLHREWTRFSHRLIETEYVDNTMCGKCIEYNSDGSRRCETYYENNELHGPYVYYDEDDRVKERGIYLHGRKIVYGGDITVADQVAINLYKLSHFAT